MNAKHELINLINSSEMKCATITIHNKLYDLKLGYTDQELLVFIDNLNFDYDSGFGLQELFGTIWMQDGSWYTRAEYNGSEWWKHNKLPDIPNNLFKQPI